MFHEESSGRVHQTVNERCHSRFHRFVRRRLGIESHAQRTSQPIKKTRGFEVTTKGPPTGKPHRRNLFPSPIQSSMESGKKQNSFVRSNQLAVTRQGRSFDSHGSEDHQGRSEDFRQSIAIGIWQIQNDLDSAFGTHFRVRFHPCETVLAEDNEVLHEDRQDKRNHFS